MEAAGILRYAGDHGPYLFIIAIQFRVILRLLDLFFAQQRAAMEANKTSERALNIAEQGQSKG